MRRVFKDRNGSAVRVGDVVKAVGVNEGLVGVVVALDARTNRKPFVVAPFQPRKATRDNENGTRAFMNPAWTEKVKRRRDKFVPLRRALRRVMCRAAGYKVTCMSGVADHNRTFETKAAAMKFWRGLRKSSVCEMFLEIGTNHIVERTSI